MDHRRYISGDKKGAIALLNKKTNENSLQIGCRLHIIQIIMNHFKQEAFGALANSTGFSRKPHPNNLLYLAWKLHDGYDSSDKDKPFNLNSQIIKNLYDDIIITNFNCYFIPVGNHNTSKQYYNDWCSFQSWLLNSKLNIQIKCLINFAKHFYEPLIQFMIEQDKTPHIYKNNQFINLSSGLQAHEMPDKVYKWYRFLQEFAPWLHLPLAVCCLGSNNARSFASSFYRVVLIKPWARLPNDLELRFAEELENNLRNGKIDSKFLLISLFSVTAGKFLLISSLLVTIELFQKNPYTKVSDIYSFGIIMVEMTTEKRSFNNYKFDIDLAIIVCNGLRPRLAHNPPDCYVELENHFDESENQINKIEKKLLGR
ncbi:hypothetical protein C2G38_2174691 [Gigaspora rosea]|uniref:Protein kinase domain-containing protein n=1 Tax=Gigaspora rosea TaxID=44941 RepID=A0A397VLG6_9GLOM|nr:hypothetical protein C2G38_2174691 [Gigaspora rosea]